jgi:hypothetical protein
MVNATIERISKKRANKNGGFSSIEYTSILIGTPRKTPARTITKQKEIQETYFFTRIRRSCLFNGTKRFHDTRTHILIGDYFNQTQNILIRETFISKSLYIGGTASIR